MKDGFLIESLIRYVGRTVTIFTTSGGLSGEGFTGVLACVGENSIKLITDIGAAPACPVGSTCDGRFGCGGCGGYGNGYGNGYGYGYGYGFGCGSNWLGSVTEIPICHIASFTHNAI